MSDMDWLIELERLAYRYSYLGMNPDLSTMTLAELWGLYCRLRALG